MYTLLNSYYDIHNMASKTNLKPSGVKLLIGILYHINYIFRYCLRFMEVIKPILPHDFLGVAAEN